jgi:hypothetical protein
MYDLWPLRITHLSHYRQLEGELVFSRNTSMDLWPAALFKFLGSANHRIFRFYMLGRHLVFIISWTMKIQYPGQDFFRTDRPEFAAPEHTPNNTRNVLLASPSHPSSANSR